MIISTWRFLCPIFKILKVEEEIKMITKTVKLNAEKIEEDLNAEIQSLKVSLGVNCNFFTEVLNSQKIKINLLTTFLIMNFLLVVILGFCSLKL